MAKKPLPTPEVLRQLLSYNPETGEMFWRPRPLSMFPDDRSGKVWNTKNAGKPTFRTKDARGYLLGRLFNRPFWAHRVAFAIHHGFWPEGDVDHINGVKGDNRAENLRDATRGQNIQNQAARAGSISRFKGVSVNRASGRCYASVGRKYLGRFPTEEEAARAYDAEARSIYGEGARLNFPDEAPPDAEIL